jgi:O-methyltransferase
MGNQLELNSPRRSLHLSLHVRHGIRDIHDAGLSPSQVLKTPAAMNLTAGVYTYLLSHTREHQALVHLRATTSTMLGSHMQITPDQGAFLALLVKATNARRIIEVGVFTGYSSLAMALALDDHEGSCLYALDKDQKTMAIARSSWDKAGVGSKVVSMVGSAEESLLQLIREGAEGTYDFAFIDADKRMYGRYYELLLSLVRPGGMIVADNCLFYGKVADPKGDKAAIALAEFNKNMLEDERVDFSLVPVGDGMALMRKR